MGARYGVVNELRRRLTGRKLVPVAVSALAIVVAAANGWVAAEPVWALVGAVVGAFVLSEVVAATLRPGPSALTRHAAVALQLGAVAVAIYLTGWGPVLGVGFLYIVVDAFRKHGSAAETPLLVWLTASVAAGQAAIAAGLAPSLIDRSIVHGVAALGLVALGVSVEFFGAATRTREAQEAHFRALVQHSADAITVIAADGTIAYASPAALDLLATSSDALVGLPAARLIHPDDAHLADAVLARVLGEPSRAVQGELRFLAADATTRRVEFTATNLLADPAVKGIVVNARDMSARVGGSQALEREATDALTGLANRVFFEARLHAVAQRMAVAAQKFAVIVVDLDHFDRVNTIAGEAGGDRLLASVAERLVSCVRPGDLAARLGDDEFAVLVCDILGADDVIAVASRVTAALRAPFVLDADDVELTASVGVALCQPGIDAGGVLREAQLAVRAAKQRGGDRYELFDARVAGTLRRRLDLAAEVGRALERHELAVYYQPVVDLHDDAVVGFEALVRWHHPSRGVVLPAEFIPIAEQSGAIDAIGEWVLAEACRQAGAWRLPTGGSPDMHVNLSARQLTNPNLAARVEEALREASLDPSQLVLEITETVLMEDIQASVDAIDVVRETGVRFAIDDFGAGYSSFAYLTRLPIDVLKLDRSLIDRLGDHRDVAVVDTVVGLAHRLGLTALAEGVECREQLDLVRRSGCDLFQGFCFQRPVPASDAALLLAGID